MLSLIVVVYNMRREAPRTLYTLSPSYQIGMTARDYEVLVVENGSSSALGEDVVRSFGKNFRYLDMKDRALPSPCRAINEAARVASGDHLGIMVDGARMASPGLLSLALRGLALVEDAVVATLAWHLGPKPQSLSIQEGYCQDVEDALLDSIGWREDGYELFEHSALAWSSIGGYFAPIAESNALFLRRDLLLELGGFDERFSLPGGGYANLDFYKRVCDRSHDLVLLLGEGTFHQVHGGIATNATSGSYVNAAAEQYAAIRGARYSSPRMRPWYIGHPHPKAIRWITGFPGGAVGSAGKSDG